MGENEPEYYNEEEEMNAYLTRVDLKKQIGFEACLLHIFQNICQATFYSVDSFYAEVDHLNRMIPNDIKDRMFILECMMQDEWLNRSATFCSKLKGWIPNYLIYYTWRIHSVVDLLDRKKLLIPHVNKQMMKIG